MNTLKIAIAATFSIDGTKNIPAPIAEEIRDDIKTRAIELLKGGYKAGEYNGYFEGDIPDIETPEDGHYCRG